MGGYKVVLLGVDGRGEGGCREGCECELHGGERRKRREGRVVDVEMGTRFDSGRRMSMSWQLKLHLHFFVVGLWFGSR